MKCVIDKELFRKEYPILGPKEFAKKYNLNRSTIRNWGWKLQIKYNAPKKQKRCCEECDKEICSYQKLKRQLCMSCSAKLNYANRGKFTNNNSKFWIKVEVEDLKYFYYNESRADLCYMFGRSWNSIIHKASRLGLKRNPIFMEEGNKKGRQTMKDNNPMKNKEYRDKATNSLKKLYEEHPEKLLNARLKRNKMTSIENEMSKLLDSLKINYEWNKMVRTKNTWRFPDFQINGKDLIIECDGIYWHKDKKEQDEARQKELEALGFKVIRFTDEEILKDLDYVKSKVLKEVAVNKNGRNN